MRMKILARSFLLGMLVLFVIGASLVATGCGGGTVDAKIANSVASDLMCPCGGCDDVLVDCHCETATELKVQIEHRLIKGETKEQVIQFLLNQYGTRILAP